MKKSVLLPFDRYQQLLQGTANSSSSVQEPDSQIEGEDKPDYKSDRLNTAVIVACLPKRNRLKAQRLLDYLDKHTPLDWNKDGHLVVENQPIEYSHIVDLLHDALNATRHEPIGYETFYKQLAGAPVSLITNPRRKSMIGGRLPPPGIPITEPKPLNVWKSQWKPL